MTGVVLTKQLNSAGATEFEEDAHGEALYRLHKLPGVARWYWHSHGSMGAFWSSTDVENMQQFDREGFTFETVLNKNREVLSAYVQGCPFLVIDEVPTEIEAAFVLSKEDQKFCEKEYQVNVESYKPVVKEIPAVGRYMDYREALPQTSMREPFLDGWRNRFREVTGFSPATPISKDKEEEYQFFGLAPEGNGSDPDSAGEVICVDGVYYDLEGNVYESNKDDFGMVWLNGEGGTFPLEEVEDVSDELGPDGLTNSERFKAQGGRLRSFRAGAALTPGGPSNFTLRRSAQAKLPLIGGTDQEGQTAQGAGSTEASRDAGEAGGIDPRALAQNPNNGGGGRGDRLIYDSGTDEDGLRERIRIRS